MRPYRVSPQAEQDIEAILAWTHDLLYRTLAGGPVEIGRVLHDGMDLKRHLPEEYRAGPDEPEARD